MSTHDPEIERLRAEVNCAVLLECRRPPWRLDHKESTPDCLKYRREKGEILIVNHRGRGWWDPQSDAKGDVFALVQHLDPSLNFGHARKLLREYAGLSPTFPAAPPRPAEPVAALPLAERWNARAALCWNSRAFRYLHRDRRLPVRIILAAAAADCVRAGSFGCAWFAHRDETGAVTHIETRGPDFRGSLRGGRKSLFRFPGGEEPPRRLVLAEAAIDALSLAALEFARADTLYAATGGGMGAATIEAIRAVLARMAPGGRAIFCSAGDADQAGDRYAAHHEQLAHDAGVAFHRLRPPIEDADWNDVLKEQAQRRAAS